MHELLILVSLKSHVIAGLVGLFGGGALGFLYGGSVERKAAAAVASAKTAASKVAGDISKKL